MEKIEAHGAGDSDFAPSTTIALKVSGTDNVLGHDPLEVQRVWMRAQLLKQFGGPDNFDLVDIAQPPVRLGTVLVRVAATSVNQDDVKILEGLPIGPDLAAVLGADLAGTIEKIDGGVMGFSVGDEVYGCAGGVKGQSRGS